MTPTKTNTPKNNDDSLNSQKPSYEDAVLELEKLIADMESGKLSLEATLVAYKRGAELIKQCQGLLEQVEQQIKIFEAKE